MARRATPPPTVALLVAVMLLQSVVGLVYPAVYRDPPWVRAAWFATDLVTLLLAAPLLVMLAIRRARRREAPGPTELGVVGYATYNYAYYLLGAELNACFVLYLAGVLLAAGILLHSLRPQTARPPLDTSARIAGLALAMIGAGLAIVWIALWAGHVMAGRPTPIEPDAFRLVAALDLTLLVPPLVAGGVAAWRRSAWGRVLPIVAGMLGTLYLVGLTAGSVVVVQRGLARAPGEAPLWAVLLVVTLAATLRIARGDATRISRSPPAPAPRGSASRCRTRCRP